MLRREEYVNKSHQLVECAGKALAPHNAEHGDVSTHMSDETMSEETLLIDGGSSNISVSKNWLEDLHREFDRTIDTLSKNPQFCCQQHMNRLKLYRLAIKRLLMKQQENAPALA